MELEVGILHKYRLEGFKHICAIDLFFDEFSSMCGKGTGERKRYKSWLYSILNKLDHGFLQELIRLDLVEVLTDCKPVLYSIRHAHSKYNERYLYAYFDGSDVVLLAAFKEKNKGDYTRGIDRAQQRREELEK